MKPIVGALLILLLASSAMSATPQSERRRLEAIEAARQAGLLQTRREAAAAAMRYTSEQRARAESPEPLPKLRTVNGKLYDVEKSSLWTDLADLTVLETNTAGATVQREVPFYVLHDGSPVNSPSMWEYRGKVLSVTDEGCLVTGEYSTSLPAERGASSIFFVSGLTGRVDEDAVLGYAVLSGVNYEYVAASGAKKTVRSFKSVYRDKLKEKLVVRNLKRPAGTFVRTIRVLKMDEGVYDCGVAYTAENRKALTNSVANAKP